MNCGIVLKILFLPPGFNANYAVYPGLGSKQSF